MTKNITNFFSGTGLFARTFEFVVPKKSDSNQVYIVSYRKVDAREFIPGALVRPDQLIHFSNFFVQRHNAGLVYSLSDQEHKEVNELFYKVISINIGDRSSLFGAKDNLNALYVYKIKKQINEYLENTKKVIDDPDLSKAIELYNQGHNLFEQAYKQKHLDPKYKKDLFTNHCLFTNALRPVLEQADLVDAKCERKFLYAQEFLKNNVNRDHEV